MYVLRIFNPVPRRRVTGSQHIANILQVVLGLRDGSHYAK